METQAGLLRLQEPCVQRICWITEDTLEFLAFKHIDVDCTGPNEKQQRDVVAQIVICTSVTGSVTALCVKQSLETKQEHQELGPESRMLPPSSEMNFCCPVLATDCLGLQLLLFSCGVPQVQKKTGKMANLFRPSCLVHFSGNFEEWLKSTPWAKAR